MTTMTTLIHVSAGVAVLVIALGSGGCSTAAAADVAGECGLAVKELRCEYRMNPQGIDVVHPRLSWIVESAQRGQKQSAYQILVASSETDLSAGKGDLWDSQKVNSDQTCQITYAGKDLPSRQDCVWKVRVWDKDGKPSEWSAPARWSMGLCKTADWQARWIGCDAALEVPEGAKALAVEQCKWVRYPDKKRDPKDFTFVARKQFEVPAGAKVRRAVFSLYCDNECKATVNGKSVGQSARWESTAHLDATAAVQAGQNVATVSVSNSDFLFPAVIGKLTVKFEQGADLVVPIDASWKFSQKPAAGWDKAGFDDKAWLGGEEMKNSPWGTKQLADVPLPPPPYLRKSFSVAKPIKRATVYATALGLYELHLNGQRVGNDVFTPGWTDFHKRVQYNTYDVTGLLKNGPNAIGAILGDGWYASCLAFTGKRNWYGGKPRLMVQLMIDYADGTSQLVVTDGSWKASYGPVLRADIMQGCAIDNRRQISGWDTAEFNDSAWQGVTCDLSVTGAGSADVTKVIARAVREGKTSLKVDNDDMGGDPALNAHKELTLTFLQNGKEQTKVYPEHATVPVKDLKIVKAEYGPVAGAKATPSAVKVEAICAPPVKRYEELPALKLTEPKPGLYTFDLGQNMVGWVRLKIKGQSGQKIVVRHGEMLNPDGTLYTANLRAASGTDEYILKGGQEETFEPMFTFHGFRYVEVRGLTQKPDLSGVTGIVVHNELPRTGNFECSHPLINQLVHNIIWGQKGNYLEVPTDCPQRDERAGWTGDTQFFMRTGAFNMDVAAFFTKWLVTMCEDAQHADGSYAHVAPDLGLGAGSTAWGDAALLCTYYMYLVYGDTRVIGDHWAAMGRYMKFVESKSKDFIPNLGGFGDWLNKGGSASKEIMDTAYYAYLARLMSEMGAAIGKTDEAARYGKLAQDVKAAFVKNFVQPDGSLRSVKPDGKAEPASQTGYALAFTMDLLPQELRAKAAEKFVDEIKRFDWHLATGFIGTPRLLPGLSAAGKDDVAYRVLLQETYPSWLCQVKFGATTMWERWDGWTPDQGFQTVGMNSFNHYAFGAVGEYLYRGVAGIDTDGPGFRKIVIRPHPGGNLTYARASYKSIHGLIVSDWKIEGATLTLKVTVPANTTATVFVPLTGKGEVAEGGIPADKAQGVKFLRKEASAAVYEVGSGSYVFTVK